MYTKTTAVHRRMIVIFEKSHLNLEYNDAQISRIFYLLVTQINVVRLQNECWNKTYKKSWTHYFRTIPTIWIWEKNISLNYWISGRLVCIIYFIFLVTKSRSSRSARHLYKKRRRRSKTIWRNGMMKTHYSSIFSEGIDSVVVYEKLVYKTVKIVHAWTIRR